MSEQINSLKVRNTIFILIILIITSFVIRLYFLPFDVPIRQDGVDYFAYAYLIHSNDHFPVGYLVNNFGWSTFVSLFFSVIDSNEMLDLMNIQRILSVSLSVLTSIPIYFLVKSFFNKKVAILSAAVFLFSSHIIENSIIGIIEPLFILCIALTIMFTFYNRGKYFYVSLLLVGVSTFVRYEGILLIVPVLSSFFIKYDFSRKQILKFLIGIVLFVIILTSISLLENEEGKKLPMLNFLPEILFDYFLPVIIGDEYDADDRLFGENSENKSQIFVYHASSSFIKYMIWILIPSAILFVIISLILIPKKLSRNKIIIIIYILFLSIGALWAYGRGIQDPRYLLVLFPIVSLFTGYSFNYLIAKFNFKKIFILIIFGMLISSFIFVDSRINNDVNQELFHAAVFLSDVSNGVNEYEGISYLRIAELQKFWPDLPPLNDKNKMDLKITKNSISEYDELSEFIIDNKNNNLTHIMVSELDEKEFLKSILYNEEKYSYLEKVYESDSFYKISIFKINYSKFSDFIE